MTLKEIQQMVKEWTLYHNMVPLRNPAGTFEVWLKSMQKIPSEAVPWIIERGKDGDPPRNIPNQAWALFRNWRETHPEKYAPDSMMGPSCSNPWCEDGLIHVGKENEAEQYMVYAFRCGVCRKALEGFPYSTPGELSEFGYVLDSIEKTFERVRRNTDGAPRRRDGGVDWRKVAKMRGEIHDVRGRGQKSGK